MHEFLGNSSSFGQIELLKNVGKIKNNQEKYHFVKYKKYLVQLQRNGFVFGLGLFHTF